MDPPYQADLYSSTLVLLGSGATLAPAGLVIAEHDRRIGLEDQYGGLRRFRTQRTGDTAMSFFHFNEPGPTKDE